MKHTPILVITVASLVLSAVSTRRWGEHGHTISAQAAVSAIPAEMPAFFREASAQLVALNPEPDRWRRSGGSARTSALVEGSAPEHFLNLELIPAARRAGFFAARDRRAYNDSLRRIGRDATGVGVLPFRVFELTERLRVSFRDWRRAGSADARRAIEARIITDAGILGHYVTDAANPAHASKHYNGWKDYNPNGYATDDRFHERFETRFVQRQVTARDLTLLVPSRPRRFDNVRAAVLAHIDESNALIERLYQLDKRRRFSADNTDPTAKAFAAERLAAGATMLRDLWWTAWVTSADDAR